MDLNMETNGAAPAAEVISTETPEAVVETPAIDETPVDEVLAAETVEEQTSAEAVIEEEASEEAPVAEDVAPIVYDTAASLSDLKEQAAPVLDKYELDPDLAGYISALESKAENPFTEFEDYGTTEEVKVLLERQVHLNTARQEEQGIRPNTDKFAESLAPETKQWLYYDLGRTPSSKYQGYNQFQEMLIDTLAIEGDTTDSVTQRFQTFVEAMKVNSLPTSNVPSFVPQHLHEAFLKLNQDSRYDISVLDEREDAVELQQKLAELQLIQNGLDSARKEAQRDAEAQAAAQRSYQADIVNLQEGFYDTFRTSIAAQLTKDVQFSADPKIQAMQVGQHIALVSQACDEGKAGEWARKTLADSGVNFDYAKAQQLLKSINVAATNLAHHKRAVGADGQSLNKVELNKATKDFQNAGKEWQKFAQDLISQQARITATSKAEDIKVEAAKQKVALKARPAMKGAATPAKTRPTVNPHAYGTSAYYEFQAEELLAAQAKRAAAYAQQ